MSEHAGHGQHDTHAAPRSGAPAAGTVKPGYPELPELPGRASAGEHGRAQEVAAQPPSAAHGDEHAAHDRHAGHSVAMFRTRFWIALLLTLPTVVWGHMLPSVTGWHAPAFPGSTWLAPVLGTIVFAYGGSPFVRGAARELRDRLPGMMTLIALAISVAFVFSVAVTIGYPGMPLWEELATLVTVMLLGHWIEMRSIAQAQGALKELAKLLPAMAVRIAEGGEEEVPLAALRDGDVDPGPPRSARSRRTASVQSGESAVDESMITGESRPVQEAGRRPGHRRNGERSGVAAGRGDRDRRADGARRHHAARGSRADLALARAGARGSRRVPAHHRRASPRRVVTAIAWGLAGAPGRVRRRARRHGARHRLPPRARPRHPARHRHLDDAGGAVGPARPRPARARGGAQAHDGGLRQDRHAHARRVPRGRRSRTVGGLSEAEALAVAAAVERDSEHPVAQAVVRTARGAGPGDARRRTASRRYPDRASGRAWTGGERMVGGPNLLRRLGATLPPELDAALARGRGARASRWST